MKKQLLVLLLLCSSVSIALAQVVIRGTLKSGTETLVGANIYVKGTTIGTVSDADGAFILEVSENNKSSMLIISLIGYKTLELPIGNRTTYDLTMEEDLQLLSEVVVVGYIAQERAKITGAVNTVGADLISRLPLPSIDGALQGRAPGVVVTQNTGAPGEGVAVRIRGAGSINSGNSPLYVVDGVPTQDINNIATQDIASITVLKDAGATAVYGSRAANGVVIVTTKTGSSAKTQIQFSSQVGVQEPSRTIAMADTKEYVSIYNEAATNDNVGKNPLLLRPLIPDALAATLPNVNQIDAILRKGILQSHSLSISGGEGKTHYFISGNYFDQQGIIKSSQFNRISTRINIDSEVKSWLRTGVNINISKSTTDLIGSSGDGAGGNGGSVIRYAFFRTPAIPIYDASGNFTDKPDRFDFFGDGYNPVGMLAFNNNQLISNRLFGKFFIELTLLRGLKFTSNFGLDLTNSNQRRFDRNWGTGGRINGINQLSVSDVNTETTTFSNFATYSKTFGEQNVTLLAGMEAIKIKNYSLFATEKDFADQTTALTFLGNGRGQKTVQENKNGSSLLSYFLKANYDYQEKYLISATFRRDGSSRFGSENRWGTFYAGSLGWRIDKESFLVTNKTINRLLLRAGYGAIGNQEIPNYAYSDAINAGYNYPFGSTRTAGYAVAGLGNSKIKWETSQQFNVGVDLELWDGKFSASVDYFNKTTSDLLVRQPIASSSGADNSGFAHFIWVNNGQVRNSGIELVLNYANKVRDFSYSISANAATLKNEVLDVNPSIPNGAIGSDRITLTEKGFPIGSFYLYEMEGIFQNNTDIFTHAYQGTGIQPGDVKFKDQNEDGLIDGRDRTHVGSPIPTLTAGLNVNLNYKNWDMSIFFQGAYGQKIFSVLNRDIEGFYRPFNVTQRYFENHWTGPGTSNQFPRASWDASGNNTRYSTRFLEDGSYTRLKNVQIGYTLPKNALTKYGFSAARIYISGVNLLTITNYQGLDPEMTVSNNAAGQGDGSAGLDWGTYPAARSYNIGVNLTF
ncbi:MAG: TonB-dependent receptor [Bacteroidetes bacterium]|nr:TonB-dependent receptor [Bacteroidota bacterium]